MLHHRRVPVGWAFSARRIASVVLLLMSSLFASTVTIYGHAKSSSEVDYTRTQVYSGALRYLRIDLGYEVTEKDPDSAYLLFRYVPHGKQEETYGAVEIIETEKSVRVTVKLPQLPTYHETIMRDGLLKKLREDYGSPSRRTEDEKPPEPPSESPEAPEKEKDSESKES